MQTALTGLRIVRERPLAMVAWAIMQMTASVAFISLLVGFAGPDIVRWQTLLEQSPGDQSLALEAARSLAPIGLLIGALILTFAAVLTVAITRAVFYPDDDPLGYVRLGLDEARQFLVLGLWGIGVVAIYFGARWGLGALIGLAAPGLDQSQTWWPWLTHWLALAIITVISLRLCLSTAVTFATKRVNLWTSWSLTRGQFWRIAGTAAYVGLFVLSIFFATVLLVALALAILNGGDPTPVALHPDFSSLGAFYTKDAVTKLVLRAFASALTWPIMLAPPAAIYLALTRKAA